jgi:carboxypeptidase C (cathepsin A)
MYYSMYSAHKHGPTQEDSRIPLILWFQGGPGASSQYGAHTENGPIRITKSGLKEFSSSWNIMGHTVFIDQPLGVGFSYQDSSYPLVNTARIAADHLLNFLYNLYRQWPALKKSPLYITGESFAGHYIPAFASKIVKNASFLNFTGINLEGVAIGDGWTDPTNQINHYDSYLYSVGIVSNQFRDTCTWFQTQAIHHMKFGDNKNVLVLRFRPLSSLTSSPTTMIPGTSTWEG